MRLPKSIGTSKVRILHYEVPYIYVYIYIAENVCSNNILDFSVKAVCRFNICIFSLQNLDISNMVQVVNEYTLFIVY